MSAALDRFVEALPAKPYATDDFNTGLYVVNKSMAVKAVYVQLHGKRRAYLPFDIDREGAAFAWEEAGLPSPTITVINTKNAHAHLLYELEAPVAFTDSYGRGQARDRPMAYYKAVLSAYREKLLADPAYVGVIVKNPLHDQWRVATNDRAYSLGELADYVDLKRRRPFEAAMGVGLEKLPQVIPQGFRNDLLFSTVRKLAYARLRQSETQEELHNVVVNLCAIVNQRCAPPLGHREVMRIARSISGWCWQKRESLVKGLRTRGALGLPPLPPEMEPVKRLEEVKRRKVKGALYVHELRKSENEAKIRAAIQQLLEEGRKVSKAAVSRLSGLSRQAVSAPHYAALFP